MDMPEIIFFIAALMFLLWARFGYVPPGPPPEWRLRWHDRHRYHHRFETWRMQKSWRHRCQRVTAIGPQIS